MPPRDPTPNDNIREVALAALLVELRVQVVRVGDQVERLGTIVEKWGVGNGKPSAMERIMLKSWELVPAWARGAIAVLVVAIPLGALAPTGAEIAYRVLTLSTAAAVAP